MSFAPPTILAARALVKKHVPQLSWVELGIVGDDAHANSGTGYHLGKDALKASAYSIIESARDKRGLSNAASALDIGWFKITAKGKTWTLRDFSKWLVAECERGAADTKDIREVIYSPDGKVVKRWDALKKRTSGDDSHLSHSHLSWFRDSEFRDKTSIFKRWFIHIGLIEGDEDMPITTAEFEKIRSIVKEEVAKTFTASTFEWSADNPADPKSYRRTPADLIGDVWAAIMRGTTRGGQPLPSEGALSRQAAMLAEANAKIDALDVPVVTKETVRAAMIDIITGAGTAQN